MARRQPSDIHSISDQLKSDQQINLLYNATALNENEQTNRDQTEESQRITTCDLEGHHKRQTPTLDYL